MLIDKFVGKRASGPCRLTASEKPARSLLKALSWRVTGSLDTMLLSWFFTQEISVAVAIGTTEVLTKTVLYYGHERIWNRISLGREREPTQPDDHRPVPDVFAQDGVVLRR